MTVPGRSRIRDAGDHGAFDQAFASTPLVAILRGLEPSRAADVGEMLVEAGFRLIEVPLNSPDPLRSIRLLADRLAGRAVVGAGTVLSAADVDRVAGAGGRLIVAPNLDSEVGEAALNLSLDWCPGVMTPTEAFAAIRQGATALKLFPAELIPPAVVTAMRAVLPSAARLVMVGGVRPDNMAAYAQAGADGFGLGSSLFKPSMSDDQIRDAAHAFMTHWRALPAR